MVGLHNESVKMNKLMESEGEFNSKDCRGFRLVALIPNGTTKHYTIRAKNKATARNESFYLIRDMIREYADDRILWKMAGDTNWNLASKQRDNLFDKLKNAKHKLILVKDSVFSYFFEEEIEFKK